MFRGDLGLGPDPQTGRLPLQDVRVVAVEHSVAGPLSTRILAELGADVVKVERQVSGGDFARHWDTNAAGESAQFWWLNRRKRSIAIDLQDPEQRRTLTTLLDGADVLVYNMSPAAAQRAGLDRDALAAAHPRLIACQISGYGAGSQAAGHRKAYDMLIQAEAGVMSLTGTPEEACRVGVSICDVSSGIYACLLILAALRRRDQSGEGAHLDVAMFDVALEFLGPMLTSNLNAGVEYGRSSDRHHAIAPYGVFTCGDGGRILLAIEQDAEWQAFCEAVLGEPQLAADPRFLTNSTRIANREAVDAIVDAHLRGTSREEFVAVCDEHGFAYGLLNDVAEVAEHPVVAEREIVATAENGAGTEVRGLVGIAERSLGGGLSGRVRPPRLDEDGEEILGSLGSA